MAPRGQRGRNGLVPLLPLVTAAPRPPRVAVAIGIGLELAGGFLVG